MSSSMVANTGDVFSASITTQMEVIVSFSFTFGSFPEVTVPRNPASGSPAAGGNVFAGVRSDLTPRAPVTSRGDEEDAYIGAVEVEGTVEVHDLMLGSFVGWRILDLCPLGDEVSQGL